MIHELKIIPCYFEAAVSGDKRFEIRRNSDRGFQKGDSIVLKETDAHGNYTGRKINGEITYVTNYGQKEDYVVFGWARV